MVQLRSFHARIRSRLVGLLQQPRIHTDSHLNDARWRRRCASPKQAEQDDCGGELHGGPTNQAQRRSPPSSDYGVTSPSVMLEHRCEGKREAWMATGSSRRSQTKAEARWPGSLQRMARRRAQSRAFLDCEMQRARMAAAHPATRLRIQTDWNSARPPIRIPKTTQPKMIHPQRRNPSRAFVAGVLSFMVCGAFGAAQSLSEAAG